MVYTVIKELWTQSTSPNQATLRMTLQLGLRIRVTPYSILTNLKDDDPTLGIMKIMVLRIHFQK